MFTHHSRPFWISQWFPKSKDSLPVRFTERSENRGPRPFNKPLRNKEWPIHTERTFNKGSWPRSLSTSVWTIGSASSSLELKEDYTFTTEKFGPDPYRIGDLWIVITWQAITILRGHNPLVQKRSRQYSQLGNSQTTIHEPGTEPIHKNCQAFLNFYIIIRQIPDSFTSFRKFYRICGYLFRKYGHQFRRSQHLDVLW